jgi:hypothetical protein
MDGVPFNLTISAPLKNEESAKGNLLSTFIDESSKVAAGLETIKGEDNFSKELVFRRTEAGKAAQSIKALAMHCTVAKSLSSRSGLLRPKDNSLSARISHVIQEYNASGSAIIRLSPAANCTSTDEWAKVCLRVIKIGRKTIQIDD